MRKALLAEFIGTFIIVFCPVAYGAIATLDATMSNSLEAALVSGIPVLAMIYTLGHVSGAHFNPAVTIGLASTGHFPKRDVLPYLLVQFAGAIFAAALSALFFVTVGGAHIPTSPHEITRNIGTEFFITFILMFVIKAASTDSKVPKAVIPLVVGLMVVVGVLLGGPVTGGSMNPARSLGPALFQGKKALDPLFVYLVGPILGALAGSRAYEWVRSKPDK
jgi:MIP family channel proteins